MIPEIKNKRVLVIDNDPDVIDIMSEALSYEGYQVDGRTDTNQIFSLIQNYHPDIVILDYILNGVNGGEICHQIKTNDDTTGLPVIIMSAYPRVINSLGHYGCNVFISKPFDLSYLMETVNQLVGAENSCVN